jgi:type I restriction enzyme S subunit
MTSLKPYPAYKDSGVEWLGDIPASWELVQLARLADERKVRNEGLRETTVLSLSYGRIIVKKNALGGLSPADYSTYQIVDPGNVILRLTDLQNDQRSLRVGLAHNRGIITSAYVCLKPGNFMDSRFLYLILHDFDVKKMFYGMGAGVRQGLSYRELKKTVFALPPLDEQRAIADFLDGMDARITRFIASRRKMITLLEEQKQAVINEAVTRGLDPDVPLKDSGVDWLGKIPAQWELKRLKQVCSAIVDCKNRTPDLVDGGGFTVVRTINIRSGKFDLDGSYPTDERNYQIWTQRGAPQTGDVFFTREAPAGEACLVPDIPNLCMGQRMMYFRPDPVLLDSTFLLHSLYGPVAKTFVDNATNGSTVGHLRLGQVSSIPLLWCSIEEQRSIAMHIDRETSRIDTLISHNKREIQLMLEYRTRLISDVVTGKLDVRGVELPPVESMVGEEIESAIEDEGAEMVDDLVEVEA